MDHRLGERTGTVVSLTADAPVLGNPRPGSATLDPVIFGAAGFPEPGGLSVAELAGAVRGLMVARDVAGMGIMEFMPRSPADVNLVRIVRIVADALFAETR